MTYHALFNPTPDDPKRWREEKHLSGGGPLSDMGSHMLDVLIGLLGLPRGAFAKIKTLLHDYTVEDSAAVLMEMPDGAPVIASFHWSSNTWAHELEIVGSDAKLRWVPFDSGKVVLTVGRDFRELELPNAENAHDALISDFVAAVREGREPVVPLAEAAKTNQLLDAIYRSGQTGREVTL